MKILLTGGGTGGHFYPVIAVAEEIIAVSKEMKLLSPEIFFASDSIYDEKAIFDLDIEFIKIPAGKKRTYFSFLNYLDLLKTGWGIIIALWKIYFLYPDIVFAKGGYASFPTLFAAKIFGIPVIIHESDSVPGRVNKWAGKFAKKIAVSFAEAASLFPEGKTAHTGNPIRKEIKNPARSGASEFLGLEENIPTILVLGGSQGAQILNEAVLEALPRLLEKYQVIHQTGNTNLEEVEGTAKIVLEQNAYALRYKPFGFLNSLALRMSAGVADVVISRAGSSIFEIASWGLPSIIVPISSSNGDHQRKNAFNYARSGGAIVVEEKNLTPNILVAEVDRIIENSEIRVEMSKGAEEFAIRDSAGIIARAIIELGLSHEQ